MRLWTRNFGTFSNGTPLDFPIGFRSELFQVRLGGESEKSNFNRTKSDQIGGLCPLSNPLDEKISRNFNWLKTDDWKKKFSLEIWKSGNCDYLFLGILNGARQRSFFCLNNFFEMFFHNFFVQSLHIGKFRSLEKNL